MASVHGHRKPERPAAESPKTSGGSGPSPDPLEGRPPEGAKAPRARGARPVERLRSLALSLERLAAQGLASGALRGAADELRTGVPAELNGRFVRLLEETLTLLESLVHSAGEGESLPQRAAEEVIRGTIQEFRRMVPELRPMTQELLVQLRAWLERAAVESSARAELIRAPGDRARVAAVGAVAGALEQLLAVLPALGPPAATVAEEVGRGLVRGSTQELGRSLRAMARSPVFRVVACGAIAVLVLLRVRR
jgi:hypothetical protein